ncbi:hypothetical protein Si136_00319 [Streptococcus infantarius subsp. infantarius]|nr:hypothetical protein [Streptococcus infantarius subsp. infantarius]
MIIMKKLFSILVVLLSVLCFLGGEKVVLAESNSLETFRGYVNNGGKSSESRLGINNIYIDDNSQTIVGYCFNIKKQYSSMYGDRYTKCTNVTVEQMKENSSSTLEDAKTPVVPEEPQSNTLIVDDPTTPSSNSDKQSEKKQEKKSLLPSTGDSSRLGLMMLGLALVLSVIFGFVYKAKRAKA